MSEIERRGNDIKNVIEARATEPTYINLSEAHKNDDLTTLYKNNLRVIWNTSIQNSQSAKNIIQWNNIQPPNVATGISDFYIQNTSTFTFTLGGADADKDKLGPYLEKLFKENIYFNDINAALYHTQISMTGQSSVGEPYIDLAIRRFYDEDFYDPSATYNKKDKNVSVKITKTGDHYDSVVITYYCSSPLLHPLFSSKNDLAGINSFTVQSQYNLFNIFSYNGELPAIGTAMAADATITLTLTTDFKICYNQINYSQSLKEYSTLCTNEYYFTEENMGEGTINTALKNNNMFKINVRDVPGAPICQYLMAINDPETLKVIDDTAKTITHAQEQAGINTIFNYYIPIKLTLENITLDVNNNTNAYNCATPMDVLHCSKKAGYMGTFGDFDNKYFPAVYGFSTLQYKNYTNTTDTYRFACSNSKTFETNRNTPAGFRVYCVYLYPALFYASDTGSGYINTVGAPFVNLIKSDSDIDTYLRMVEEAGYSGGSLWTWLKGLRDKLKKGRYISNTAKTVSNILNNDGVKSLVSMIPGVGPAISSGMSTAKGVADKIGDTAEKLGYGVSMF